MSTESREFADHLHARTGVPMSVCSRWSAEVFAMVAAPGRNALARLGALRMIAEGAGFITKALEAKAKDDGPEQKPSPLTYKVKEAPPAASA